MKKRVSFSFKQCLLFSIVTFTFICITLYLFTYKKDELRFKHITTTLFTTELCGNTLNLHYTLATPEQFGILNHKPALPIYDSTKELSAQAFTENVLASLEKINPKKLNEADRYTYQLLKRSLQNQKALFQFPYFREPLSPSSGMQCQLPILFAEYTFRTRRDVEDYLALLNQTDEYFASLLLFEQEKKNAGLLMGGTSIERVREQCNSIITKKELDANEHFLQTSFKERLEALYLTKEITKHDFEYFLTQNTRLLRTVLLPAYQALSDGLMILEDSSIPLGGLAANSGGADFYKTYLISQTGSYRSIEEIRKLLTETLTTEYQALLDSISKIPECGVYMASGSYTKLPIQNTSAMLIDLQERMQKTFPSLKLLGGTPPDTIIKKVSPCLQPYSAPAFYLSTPIDDTDTNVIYINELHSPSGLDLYTTLAHEGFPGHLYQNVYNNRFFLQHDTNKLRSILWYGGYLEGWALYVEFEAFQYAAELLLENGRETDASCVLLEMHHRSLQLCLYSLVDIMLHYDNASYEEIAEVLATFGIKDTSAASEIYTYIAENPCNYMKYYLGYLELLALKKDARALWNTDYSDYIFHQFFLECGPSDFSTLREALFRNKNLTTVQ